MPDTGREEGTVRGRGGRRDCSEQAGSWKEPREQSSVTPEMPPAASSTRRFNRSGNTLKSQDSLGLRTGTGWGVCTWDRAALRVLHAVSRGLSPAPRPPLPTQGRLVKRQGPPLAACRTAAVT